MNIVKTFILILFLNPFISMDIKADETSTSSTEQTSNSKPQKVLKGRELKKANFLETLNWLKKSSESGNILTLNRLGVEYYKGDVVDKSIETSVSYFKKSANLDSDYAAFRLGQIYSKDLKNYKEAEFWYEKAAKQNLDAAQYNLAILYETKRIKGGLTKAIYWYQEATNNNNASAQFRLGYFYLVGHGIKKDKVKAEELLRKSAAQGNKQAKQTLTRL